MASDESAIKSLGFLKETLGKKYKKLAIFSPVAREFADFNSCFSRDELISHILNKRVDELKKVVIKRYQELLRDNDFVLVIGVKILYLDKFDFNCQLAKDLNSPLVADYSDDLESKFYTFKCAKSNVESFGFMVNNSFSFTNSNKTCSFDEIKVSPEIFTQELSSCKCNITTPLAFEAMLYEKARANLKTVVMPEGNDDRILKASDVILRSGAVNLIILGKSDEIDKKANELGLDLKKATIINPEDNEYLDEFANTFYELRKSKGVELFKAKEIVKDRNYFGTMLVYSGKADAMVSGADGTSADTVRPALQIVKTKPGVSCVSGAFFMCLDSEVVVFADCAITPNPTAEQLGGIAKSSIDTAKAFGISPRVAMLSYSTAGSGSGKDVDFMVEATKFAKELSGDLVDGPMQFDAAIDKVVAAKKMPNSNVAGNANVFIFPDLNCGNICYKAVQRTAGAVAMGPLLQGLKKPINDLSRGCLVEDVINTILVSAIQAGENQ
nr:phosphate acetyltransferase [Campylobacter geochelonis]